MFLDIERKKIIVKFFDEYIDIPPLIQNKISSKWNDIITENPKLWDGDITCAYSIKIDDNFIEVLCKKSKYSHYLYQERVGLCKRYECRNISAGSLLETSDGYFVLGELDINTSFPTILDVPGGNIDKKDISDGKIDCLKTIIRETKEEVNIDLNNKEIVREYSLNGFYISDEGKQPGVQIFAKAKLKINRKEMEEYFKDYYEWLIYNNGELEIKKLHFFDKKNCIEELKKLKNPKREYLNVLFKHNT